MSLLKLDVEGSEFPAIESLSTKFRMPQIAIGFHVWLNSESGQYPNEGVPPLLYTSKDVLDAVQEIKQMGYKLVYEEREHRERIGQETLFIKNESASKYHDIELAASNQYLKLFLITARTNIDRLYLSLTPL